MSEAGKSPTAVKKNSRQIALPSEHGAWGFLLEPLVVSLAIGYSTAGLFLAIMTIGSFLARQPLKVLIIDRLGQKNNERAAAAFKFLVIFGSIAAAGLAASVYLAGIGPLAPFAVILPLAAVQIYFDGSRKSRGLLPELMGAISISSSAAAILLAGGSTHIEAAAIWMIMIARLIPSIIYVRNRLRLEKGKHHSMTITIAVHAAAIITVSVFAYNGLASLLVVGVMCFLLYRAAIGLSPYRRKMKAMQIGVREVIYGVMTVAAIVIGHYTGY